MAISSILLHYNTKTGFLLVLNELDMADKELRSYMVHQFTSVNSIFHFFKWTLVDIHVDCDRQA